MRIGVVPADWRTSGGSFQHSLIFLEGLREIHRGDQFVVFHSPRTDLPVARLRSWSFETVGSNLLEQRSVVKAGVLWGVDHVTRMLGDSRTGRAWRRVRRVVSRARGRTAWSGEIGTIAHRSRWWRRLFRRHGIDLMVYLGVSESSFESGVPYVLTVLDLFHCSHPEFPEAFVHGSPDYYEYVYRNATRHATLVLVDSEQGKEDVLRSYGRYGVAADQMRILPYLPAPYLPDAVPPEEIRRVTARYRLPRRWLFYPARFWRHKNHARIFEALHLLTERHQLKVPLVLVGFDASDPPQYPEVSLHDMRALSDALGLQDQVSYVGVVPDEDMAGLYAGAAALIMPTLSPDTTIPVLEAWKAGCPVITSAIRGNREQAGDAAVLVDPLSVEAIADGIRRLWTDEPMCQALVVRGRGRLASFTARDYRERLIDILEDAKSRVAKRER